MTAEDALKRGAEAGDTAYDDALKDALAEELSDILSNEKGSWRTKTPRARDFDAYCDDNAAAIFGRLVQRSVAAALEVWNTPSNDLPPVDIEYAKRALGGK